jgi:hypothetical protein
LSAFITAFAQEVDTFLVKEHWMQPVKTEPWPKEESDSLKKMKEMVIYIDNNTDAKEFCNIMADDLLAMKAEYVPSVHYSLFYDNEEMSKLLGDCFYKLDLDNPAHINLKPTVVKFVDGFKVFMGNFDNISKNGNEVIIFANGGVSRGDVDRIRYRQQLRLNISSLSRELVLFVVSPAEFCSEKYNPSYIYTRAVSIIPILTYLNDTADRDYYGVFRYEGREFVYTLNRYKISIYWKDSIDEKPIPAYVYHACNIYGK